MAFQTPISIKKAAEYVRRNEFVLPAIQREFIWSPEQITRLFDSLLRGYPIGSFLFWKVDRDHCRNYEFYGFLKNYHERDQRHNERVNLTGDESVIAVLDGQQRLTSLYIGLRGSYTYKTNYLWYNNPDAFKNRRLYLNLVQPASSEEVELRFDFRFLTDDEVRDAENSHWFLVSNVLEFKSLRDPYGYLRDNTLLENEFAEDCLISLFEAICEKKIINYYQEEDQDVDKVLNIFIRVNSGGTQLSYSDLLLSIATAQWTKYDARQEIHDLVDELNRTGEGFNLNKDFVLKSSLVLADIQDIAFRVRNFTRENVEKIENAWPKIRNALRASVGLAAKLGFNGHTLTANNTLVPVAYYLKELDDPIGYLESNTFASDRDLVQKWIIRALLKTGTFGSGLDTTLRAARSTIQNANETFPTDLLDKSFASIGKALRFEEEEIDDLIDHTYGNAITFSVLTLLYPGVDLNNRFHVDHIFPKARFSRKRLRDEGVAEDQIESYMDRVNRVANLQLLEGIANLEKAEKMPAEWLKSQFTTDDRLNSWKRRNFIEEHSPVPESIKGFLGFYEDRRAKMKERLAYLLGVSLEG